MDDETFDEALKIAGRNEPGTVTYRLIDGPKNGAVIAHNGLLPLRVAIPLPIRYSLTNFDPPASLRIQEVHYYPVTMNGKIYVDDNGYTILMPDHQ